MKKKCHLSPENVAYIHTDVWVCIFQMTLTRSNSYSKRNFFHISLPIHFFFYLLNILCVGVFVGVSPHVCGRTYTCVHIHLEAREHLWASFLRLCPSAFLS